MFGGQFVIKRLTHKPSVHLCQGHVVVPRQSQTWKFKGESVITQFWVVYNLFLVEVNPLSTDSCPRILSLLIYEGY